MLVLGIESSCDETAASVVKDGRTVLSNVIISQIDVHKLYGGVVPEIASRQHCESICAITEEALAKANVTLEDIDAIAVTYAPGLIGALLVGVNFAKGLALANAKPLVPVHHIRGHIAANFIAHPELKPPFMCMVMSGGHSHIIEVLDYTKFNVIGKTRDDAVGEAYDKAARALGLPYPGGKYMDEHAFKGDDSAYTLPRPSIEGSEYDFSFSGLKTAVLNHINNSAQKGVSVDVSDMAASFQKAVCDMIATRLMKATCTLDYKKLVLAGGVSANKGIRQRIQSECDKLGIELFVPPFDLCTDNAAMIAAQGYYEYLDGNLATMDLNAYATLALDSLE